MENPDFCPATHWKSRRCHASRRFRPRPSDSFVEPPPESPKTGLSKRSASLGTPGKPRGGNHGGNHEKWGKTHCKQDDIYIYIYIIIYIYISESLALFLVSKPRKKRSKCWNGDVSGQSCWVPMPRGPFLTSMHVTWAWCIEHEFWVLDFDLPALAVFLWKSWFHYVQR